MDKTTAIVIVVLAFCILVVFFFTRFLHKGKFKIKSPLGEVSAEGANPLPESSVAGGIRMKEVQAGKDIKLQSSGMGGVNLEKAKATGSIDIKYTEGKPPPKS